MIWTKEKIEEVFRLRQDYQLTANEIGGHMGCTGQCIRTMARDNGFSFNRDFSDIGRPRAVYWCMRCREKRVEGRWQRCPKCAEYIREMQGGFDCYRLAL